MKLKQLSAAGFRGFNTPRTIEFHDTLTLISAPNSHGKTSITEAFEFLFYGQTSKVEDADSKEEYKDSYANRHYANEGPPYVEAQCTGNTGEVVLRAEIHGQEIRRFYNGELVEAWPFSVDLSTSARPFVVQHALKSLLLAVPSERFQGFARLLGLRDVDSLQQALVNLCTKPEAHIPTEAKTILNELSVFDARLRAAKETAPIAKELARGPDGLDDAYAKLHTRGVRLVGKALPVEGLSSALVTLRNAAAQKIYSGSVGVKTLSTAEHQRASAARDRIERALTGELFQDYSRLAVTDTSDRLRREVQLLGLGLELLQDKSDTCPLCEQSISDLVSAHIKQRHEHSIASIVPGSDPSPVRARLAITLKELEADLATHSALNAARCTDLINANKPEASQKIKALFGTGNEYSLFGSSAESMG